MSTVYPGPSSPTPPPPPYPAQPYPGFAPVEQKKRNTVGIIALVCAILGFILACVPGAMILGWVLLPFGFILGLVGLFMKAKKGTAIAAIIVSILGTIAGVFAFLAVVGSAFDESFNKDVTVSQEGASDANAAADVNGAAGAAGSTRENPLPVGATIESDEWAITLNGVNLDATGEVLAENQFNDQPGPDQAYILANVTLTYKGNDPQGSIPMAIINYVTADGTTVNSFDHSAVAPDELDSMSPLYSGGSVSGNEAFLVPSATAGEGMIAIKPDPFSKKAFFAVR